MLDDSNVGSKRLSRRLRIHPNTLLQRIKKLEVSGVLLRYSAVVDFSKVQRTMDAIIFMDLVMESGWESALRPLSKLPEVVSFMLISGEHDAFMHVRVRDELHLATMVRKMLGSGIVKKTTSHLILDSYSSPHDYNPFRHEWKF